MHRYIELDWSHICQLVGLSVDCSICLLPLMKTCTQMFLQYPEKNACTCQCHIQIKFSLFFSLHIFFMDLEDSPVVLAYSDEF